MKSQEKPSSRDMELGEQEASEPKFGTSFYWDTVGKSEVVTPHLWNDYLGIARDVAGTLKPEYSPPGAFLHELVYGDKPPVPLEERWREYPNSAPKKLLSDVDKGKVEALNKQNRVIADLLIELGILTKGLSLKSQEGKKRLFEKPWLEEPYASYRFEFDLDSKDFQARKEEIFVLLEKLKESLSKIGRFFYHEGFSYFE